jgi:hypothetical protein
VTSSRAESACYYAADFDTCSTDSSRRQYRSLCEICFPDGEIPDHVTQFLFASSGNLLHRSIDQSGEAETPSVPQGEHVTTIEEARRIAGGDA